MWVGPLGEEHVREIIPRAISFGHPPPTTVTVTDRHTGHSVHTFILHTLRAETWPAYNWYQPSTTSSFRKSPRRMSFSSSLIIHFCVRKRETTGPRVLILILVFIFILFEKKKHPRLVILILVFSFLMLEFSFSFCSPSSGLQVRIRASHPCGWCASWFSVVGHTAVLWLEPPSRGLATLSTPPTAHHPSAGCRRHLQCSCTTEGGPGLLAGMLGHAPGKSKAAVGCCPQLRVRQSLQPWSPLPRWPAGGWAQQPRRQLALLRPSAWPTPVPWSFSRWRCVGRMSSGLVPASVGGRQQGSLSCGRRIR